MRQLIAEIDRDGRIADLGGTMSLNVRIESAGLVLRVHQPFVSRRRLLALQEVRVNLARRGLVVPVPVAHGNSTVFRCGERWAELETYVPHEKPEPMPASYTWMFGAVGQLHRALSTLDPLVPRPVIATYAPPGSLWRWLRVTESAVRHDSEARDIVRWARGLARRLQRKWVPATKLPRHPVHGDARLGNVCRSPIGEDVYLDFGFMAVRPRVHELAYSLAFMALALGGHENPSRFDWGIIGRLIGEYEVSVGSRVSAVEREALAGYVAAVPLYFAGIAGFTEDPGRQLREYVGFLRLSEWVLEHPEVMV